MRLKLQHLTHELSDTISELTQSAVRRIPRLPYSPYLGFSSPRSRFVRDVEDLKKELADLNQLVDEFDQKLNEVGSPYPSCHTNPLAPF